MNLLGDECFVADMPQLAVARYEEKKMLRFRLEYREDPLIYEAFLYRFGEDANKNDANYQETSRLKYSEKTQLGKTIEAIDECLSTKFREWQKHRQIDGKKLIQPKNTIVTISFLESRFLGPVWRMHIDFGDIEDLARFIIESYLFTKHYGAEVINEQENHPLTTMCHYTIFKLFTNFTDNFSKSAIINQMFAKRNIDILITPFAVPFFHVRSLPTILEMPENLDSFSCVYFSAAGISYNIRKSVENITKAEIARAVFGNQNFSCLIQILQRLAFYMTTTWVFTLHDTKAKTIKGRVSEEFWTMATYFEKYDYHRKCAIAEISKTIAANSRPFNPHLPHYPASATNSINLLLSSHQHAFQPVLSNDHLILRGFKDNVYEPVDIKLLEPMLNICLLDANQNRFLLQHKDIAQDFLELHTNRIYIKNKIAEDFFIAWPR